MLAVKKEYRGKGIATKLVRMAIDIMIDRDADEVIFFALILRASSLKTDFRLLSRPKSPTPQQ